VTPPQPRVTCSKAQLSATRLALRSSSASGRPRPRAAPAPASCSSGPAGQPRLRLAAGGSIRLGRGRGGVGPMPARVRRFQYPLLTFRPFSAICRPGTPAAPTHPPLRPKPGPPGDAVPLRLFTTMKLPGPPLYPPPPSRPRRPSPLAPPSASAALSRHWMHPPPCLQTASAHSRTAMPVFSAHPIRKRSERHCQSRGPKDQSELEDPCGAGLMRSFGAGPGFIHNIPPPPPSGWTARPGQLGLRPHTALFTEGRFRAPGGDNQHGAPGARQGGGIAQQPLCPAPSALCDPRNSLNLSGRWVQSRRLGGDRRSPPSWW
jgi:hypothetical protein